MDSCKIFATTVVLVSSCVLIRCVSSQKDINSTTTQQPPPNETIHFFLVAVTDSQVENMQRFRQDDDDPPRMSFAQQGQYIGQLIQGVLGGDFRPVFAGSLGFVGENMAQQNLGSFLGTIAPALNLALREMYNRVTTRLGFGATTPKPTQKVTTHEPTLQEIIDASKANNATFTSPSDILVVEGGKNKPVTIYYGHEIAKKEQEKQQLAQLAALKAQVEEENQLLPSTTTSWQFVLNQIHSETTTVEPLPLIRLRTTVPSVVDTDDDDDAKI